MNIPGKQTRDQWRNVIRFGVYLSYNDLMQLIDAVDHLEAKVAELESRLEDAYYEIRECDP